MNETQHVFCFVFATAGSITQRALTSGGCDLSVIPSGLNIEYDNKLFTLCGGVTDWTRVLPALHFPLNSKPSSLFEVENNNKEQTKK